MSNGSTYGKLRLETAYHNSVDMGKLTTSGRAQRVLDLMDHSIMLKNKRKNNTQASVKWIRNCDLAIENDYHSMRTHLVEMLGRHANAETGTIDKIIEFARKEDVNNLRYNVLKLLETYCNPEAYRRLREQYEAIVGRQRG